MTWIKRNLFFVIGSLVALALMVVGVLMLLSQIGEEQRVSDEIQKQYATLKALNTEKPHPGAGSIDNIATAKDQVKELQDYIAKTRKVFQRIPAIPDLPTNKISNREFATQLANTMSLLQRSAEQQGVLLSEPKYAFSFYSEMHVLNFDAASLGPLSTHLGEVKALVDVLFGARINSLDYIRREVVSPIDDNMQDYLTQKTITNALAELTPYEVRFKCFSGELAQVLAGLAASTHGFVVKTINIVPTSTMGGMGGDMAGMAPPGAPPGPAEGGGMQPRAPMAPGRTSGGFGQPGYRPPTPMQPNFATAPPPQAPRGPQAFLNEKPVQVTLLVQVVKIRSTETKPPAAKPPK